MKKGAYPHPPPLYPNREGFIRHPTWAGGGGTGRVGYESLPIGIQGGRGEQDQDSQKTVFQKTVPRSLDLRGDGDLVQPHPRTRRG